MPLQADLDGDGIVTADEMALALKLDHEGDGVIDVDLDLDGDGIVDGGRNEARAQGRQGRRRHDHAGRTAQARGTRPPHRQTGVTRPSWPPGSRASLKSTRLKSSHGPWMT